MFLHLDPATHGTKNNHVFVAQGWGLYWTPDMVDQLIVHIYAGAYTHTHTVQFHILGPIELIRSMLRF